MYNSLAKLEATNPFINSLLDALLHYFPASLKSPTSAYMICCALDPKTKFLLREWMHVPSDRDMLWKGMLNEMISLYGTVAAPVADLSSDESGHEMIAPLLNPAANNETEIARELFRYRKLVVEHSSECNASEWWLKHHSDFPFTSMYAQRYLSIQATESENERQFSSAGRAT